MAINKIIYGDTTLIDLTNDTIEADTMLSGVTAHGANGEQIYGTMSQVTPATETPLMDGTAAVGTSIKYAREDHVHPHDSSIPTKISDLTNDSGFIAAPSANVDEVLAYNGTTWTADKRMVILSYGSSTWTDFINAYNSNAVVYCRASSNSNPASGAQTRMAFMAYVNSATPTNVEFQYYRSVSSHTDSQQGDQVFIYKLDKTAGWSVTTRNSFTKIVAGTGLGSSYSNGTLTLNNEEDGSVVSVSQTLTSGTEIASVTVDGTETKLYAPTPQSITIDSELSSISENPVQNKVINSAISEKYTKPNNGIPASDLASGVIPTVPSAASTTPADLGTAAVGTSTDYARADHVHTMPSAADVGAVSASDVPFKVYDSVEDLGLTVGSATITGAWAAMAGQNAILMCNAAEFAPNSMPSTAGNVMMYRLASNIQRGIIRYYARVPVVGDYAMEIDTSGNASGTWTPLPVGQHAQLSQNQTATFTILGNMGVLFYGRGANKYAAIITYWDSAPLVLVSSGTAPVISHGTNSNTFTVKNTASGTHIAIFLTVPTTYY